MSDSRGRPRRFPSKKLANEDIMPGVGFVDSGVAEIVRLQTDGWAYFKVGIDRWGLPMDNTPIPSASGATHATDHLANERTYLAWVRTGLAVIGLGFAVAKFGTWLRELGGQPESVAEAAHATRSIAVGLLMISTGGAVAIIAALRHRAVARQIEEGTVRPARTAVTIITIIIVMLAVAVGALTLSGSP